MFNFKAIGVYMHSVSNITYDGNVLLKLERSNSKRPESNTTPYQNFHEKDIGNLYLANLKYRSHYLPVEDCLKFMLQINSQINRLNEKSACEYVKHMGTYIHDSFNQYKYNESYIEDLKEYSLHPKRIFDDFYLKSDHKCNDSNKTPLSKVKSNYSAAATAKAVTTDKKREHSQGSKETVEMDTENAGRLNVTMPLVKFENMQLKESLGDDNN